MSKSKSGLIEQRDTRLSKIKELKTIGINPYPAKSCRTDYSDTIINNYESYKGKKVTIAGRLISLRKHGSVTFAHLQDQIGKIQLAIGKSILKPFDAASATLGYSELKFLDVGDFIEAYGEVSKTKTGEISILTETVKLLTKSLRPLPDKWSKLKDRELILRKRYLDTTANPENKKGFESLAKMLFGIRSFLKTKGFLEFLTPVLQPQYGGGTAKPFITHLNALNKDFYLSISHELYLKRLITAGFDKVFTIGRYFRNEGIDKSHHPEFSMIETMTAYENYEYNMDLIEDMFRYIAEEVYGKTKFNVKGHIIDFKKSWKRISMTDAVTEVTGINFDDCKSIEEANNRLVSLGIEEPQETIGLALAKAFEDKVEETLILPTLVFGHPIDISPLAKPMDSAPDKAERFEIFIAAMECGDNWSEQNDPVELLARWKANYKPEDREVGEFHPLDYDFIEALEYGMPPATGIGPGIERMAMIFNEQENIDDVIFFPIMKPHLSRANKDIFAAEEYEADESLDILITFDEFKKFILNEIKGSAQDIIIKPYLRFWENKEVFQASGSAEISGLFKNRSVKLAGYSKTSDKTFDKKEEMSKFNDYIQKLIVSFLQQIFGQAEINLSETFLP
ncbi:MAG: lysine--tRNA ligase [Deltaproteobacteria bacterium]|nr:lysine--tRNA ligase [Deltaproteobacteria bacterium]